MKTMYTTLFAAGIVLTAFAMQAKTTTTTARQNPLFKASALPFHAPPFNKIKTADYKPAIEEGMKQQLAEVKAIADQKAAPTFANTIEAMEKSGALLTRASKIFFALTGSNTNDTFQKIEAEESPKLAAHNDAIFMNPKLYARVKTLYDKRASSGLDAESQYLIERYYKFFVRAGAQLSDADQKTLRALNKEESTLTTKFREHVLADTAAAAIIVDTKEELAGLPDSDIAAAADAAQEKKLTGKYVLTLQNTTQQPALTYLQNRALRERLFNASVQRGNHGGPNDTKAIATRLAQLRAQKAKLLGYPTYAAFSLDDQMASTPENAVKLLTGLVPASTEKARSEARRCRPSSTRKTAASSSRRTTGSSTRRRSARPSTTSMKRRCGRTSSSTTS